MSLEGLSRAKVSAVEHSRTTDVCGVTVRLNNWFKRDLAMASGSTIATFRGPAVFLFIRTELITGKSGSWQAAPFAGHDAGTAIIPLGCMVFCGEDVETC